MPSNLIALSPAKPRSSSKLLLYEKSMIQDYHFHQLDSLLKDGDHLVFNNTKVLKARLLGFREREKHYFEKNPKIEVLLINQISRNSWKALCKPAKKLKLNDKVRFNSFLFATVVKRIDSEFILEFCFLKGTSAESLMEIGQLPIPPYILRKRDYRECDTADYQTVFAKKEGAIAAPTASLHFDNYLMKKIKNKRINYSFVTLHVGAGTFLPVREKKITEHRMHAEKGHISKKAADEINSSRENGGRIIPVGTTALRLIESASDRNGFLSEFNDSTDIFIKPGYSFKVSDGLITNFHFPNSTLFLLIVAFIGLTEAHRVYSHAINQKYRFYSYGDGSLLIPK